MELFLAGKAEFLFERDTLMIYIIILLYMEQTHSKCTDRLGVLGFGA